MDLTFLWNLPVANKLKSLLLILEYGLLHFVMGNLTHKPQNTQTEKSWVMNHSLHIKHN